MGKKIYEAYELLHELRKENLSKLEIAEKIVCFSQENSEELSLYEQDNEEIIKLKRHIWLLNFFYLNKH
jgi:Zn/Cd-binding protein ZinT